MQWYLIIDDDAHRFDMISEWFKAGGRAFFWAPDFYTAMRSLHDRKYDRIFTDHDLGVDQLDSLLDLPEATGVDIAKYLVQVIPQDGWPRQVIVHSRNPVGAENVANVYRDAGIDTYVIPYHE